MGKKKPRHSNQPRRQRLKQKDRLEAAKLWLPTYQGQKLFRAYRKRYGVDWPTALRELELLGVAVDPAFKEQVLRTVQAQAERKKQKQLEKTNDNGLQYGVDYDDHFAFIVGFTGGGAPYGLTWEEWDDDDHHEDTLDS
jgi:hypothetical protein